MKKFNYFIIITSRPWGKNNNNNNRNPFNKENNKNGLKLK